MIQLDRRPARPAVLGTQRVKDARRVLRQKVARGTKLTRKDFTGKSYWTDTKDVLHTYQYGKCCYCERRRDANAETDVDHFRPKLGVTECPTHPGYWWLAYDWKNFLLACKACNSNHKANHFPVLDERTRAFRPSDNLAAEMPAIINPSLEDPAKFISYDWESDPTRVIISGTDPEGRGSSTIGVLGLDLRDDLNRGRFETIVSLKLAERVLRTRSPNEEIYQDAIRELREKSRFNSQFRGLALHFIERQGLQGFVP